MQTHKSRQTTTSNSNIAEIKPVENDGHCLDRTGTGFRLSDQRQSDGMQFPRKRRTLPKNREPVFGHSLPAMMAFRLHSSVGDSRECVAMHPKCLDGYMLLIHCGCRCMLLAMPLIEFAQNERKRTERHTANPNDFPNAFNATTTTSQRTNEWKGDDRSTETHHLAGLIRAGERKRAAHWQHCRRTTSSLVITTASMSCLHAVAVLTAVDRCDCRAENHMRNVRRCEKTCVSWFELDSVISCDRAG